MRFLIVCFFLYFSISKTFADFTDVDELVEQSKNVISQYSIYVAPTNNNAYFENMTSTDSIEYGTFDFIIAGGGSAGLVVATRLIEANFSVLVIEAGIKDPDVAAILGWYSYYGNGNDYSWLYTSTTQENSCLNNNGTCMYPRGKILGGSSAINAGAYVRGNAKDYDEWEEFGNYGWSYSDVLPYFKKSESARFNRSNYSIDYNYHGFDGLQRIDIPQDIPILTEALLNANLELGLNETDYNGEEQLGFNRFQSYLTGNIRSSSNYSFFTQVANSTNLNITLQSLVTKVIIKNDTAVAVQFVKNGQYFIANASKEVILSAGVFGTPQILMLSGIGPASDLNELDIDVVADLPVGQNLQDHLDVTFTYTSDVVFFNYTIEELVELWMNSSGPLMRASQTCTFLDFNNDSQPDIEIGIGIIFSEDENLYFYSSSFGVIVSLLHPLSVGKVTLASADPRDYPLINPNFMFEKADFNTTYQGIKFALSLNNTAAFKDFHISIDSVSACDELDSFSDDWWYCYSKQTSTSGYHPVGTAKMGPNSSSSVVDPSLKVHGIKKLRVVDASVMPTVNSGHTNAPTVMIAEKAAEEIIQEYS